MITDSTGQNIYLVVPAIYKKVYEQLLIKMADYGVDILNDCSSTCKGGNRTLLSCWNMFQSACAAYNTGEVKKSALLINYIIKQLCLDIDDEDTGGDDGGEKYSIKFIPDAGTYKADGENKVISINRSSNVNDYSVTVSNSWIHFDKNTNTISVDANNTTSTRVGYITVTSIPGNAMDIYTVTQNGKSGGPKQLISTKYDTPDLRASYVDIPVNGGISTPNVSYSVGYTNIYSDGSTERGTLTTSGTLVYSVIDYHQYYTTLDNTNGNINRYTANTERSRLKVATVRVTLVIPGVAPVSTDVDVYQAPVTSTTKAIKVVPADIEFTNASGNKNVEVIDVYNNIDVIKATSAYDWLSYKDGKVYVTANNGNTRSGRIIFSDASDSSIKTMLAVTQYGSSDVPSTDKPILRLLSASPTSKEYNDLNKYEITVQVLNANATNVHATFASNIGWLGIDQTPQAVAKNGNYTVTLYNRSINRNTFDNKCTIVFSCDEGATEYCIIVQKANPNPNDDVPKEYKLTADPSSISAPKEGDRCIVVIKDENNNCGLLNITDYPEWIKNVSIIGNRLSFAVDENFTEARQTILNVVGENGGSAYITVTQASADIVYTLDINPKSLKLPYTQQIYNIYEKTTDEEFNNVSANSINYKTNLTDFYISTGASWITINKTSKTITFNANDKTTARSASIIFTGKSGDKLLNDVVQRCEITQDGKPFLIISPNNVNSSAEGDTSKLTVSDPNKNSGTITVSADRDWIHPSIDNGTITITTDPNSTTSTRSGTVTVTPANGESYTIPVSQNGHSEYTIKVKNLSGEDLTNKTVYVPYTKGKVDLLIDTNAASIRQTVVSGIDMLISDNIALDNSYINIPYNAYNRTDEPRTARILIEGYDTSGNKIPNCSYLLIIVQTPAPSKELNINPKEVVIPFTGGTSNAVTVDIVDVNNNCGTIIVNNGAELEGLHINSVKNGNTTTLTIIADYYNNISKDRTWNVLINSNDSTANEIIKVTQTKHPIYDYVTDIVKLDSADDKIKVEVTCGTDNIDDYINNGTLDITSGSFSNMTVTPDYVNNKLYIEWDKPTNPGTYTLRFAYWNDPLHDGSKATKEFTIEVVNNPTYLSYYWSVVKRTVINPTTKDDESYFTYELFIDKVYNQDGVEIKNDINSKDMNIQLLSGANQADVISKNELKIKTNGIIDVEPNAIIKYVNRSYYTTYAEDGGKVRYKYIETNLATSASIIKSTATDTIKVEVKAYFPGTYCLAYANNEEDKTNVLYLPNKVLNLYPSTTKRAYFQLRNLAISGYSEKDRPVDLINDNFRLDYDSTKLSISNNTPSTSDADLMPYWLEVTMLANDNNVYPIKIYDENDKLWFTINVSKPGSSGDVILKADQKSFNIINNNNTKKVHVVIRDVNKNAGDLFVESTDARITTSITPQDGNGISHLWITIPYYDQDMTNVYKSIIVTGAAGGEETLDIYFEQKSLGPDYLYVTNKIIRVSKDKQVIYVPAVIHSTGLTDFYLKENASWFDGGIQNGIITCNIGQNIEEEREVEVTVRAIKGNITYEDTFTVIQESGIVIPDPDDYDDEYDPVIEINSDRIGDVAYTDDNGQTIKIDTIANLSTKNLNNVIPIGMVVVPGNHTFEGTPILMSLKYMDCNNPESGVHSTSANKMYFGNAPYGKQIYKSVFINDRNSKEEYSTVINSRAAFIASQYNTIRDNGKYYNNEYIPQFTFNGVSGDDKSCYYTKYIKGSEYTLSCWVPSPILSDGMLNPIYDKLLSNKNTNRFIMSTDFNKTNENLVALATVGKTEVVVTDDNAVGNYPAVITSYRYRTVGTNKGQWKLTNARTLMYMLIRILDINNACEQLNNIFGKTVASPIIYDNKNEHEDTWHWTCASSVSDVIGIVGIDTSTGEISHLSTGTKAYARAIIQL